MALHPGFPTAGIIGYMIHVCTPFTGDGIPLTAPQTATMSSTEAKDGGDNYMFARDNAEAYRSVTPHTPAGQAETPG